jgi:dTDP-4-amino-4,6-dideoxygalactose transaminase
MYQVAQGKDQIRVLIKNFLISKVIDRKAILEELLANEIGSVFHYVPLHSSPAGKQCGKTHGKLKNTNDLSSRLIRLPLWIGLSEAQQ